MRKIFIESLFVIVGMAIAVPYIISPGPLLMFLFVFVAQPCFAVAIISAAIEIYRDLKTNKVI
ncbi:hypothetical protein [Sediminitomix flava]|uniref:Uncharacterized protein n=1 Tax=Sediminitomix flava TaxID=379075 RepID=A0A315ZCM9_SEDFL|nr:hypothetical protein [Sediminitomix flava]PWJ43336.1 hypothetical protein BC781_102893 [Sediminitomix flava]